MDSVNEERRDDKEKIENTAQEESRSSTWTAHVEELAVKTTESLDDPENNEETKIARSGELAVQTAEYENDHGVDSSSESESHTVAHAKKMLASCVDTMPDFVLINMPVESLSILWSLEFLCPRRMYFKPKKFVLWTSWKESTMAVLCVTRSCSRGCYNAASKRFDFLKGEILKMLRRFLHETQQAEVYDTLQFFARELGSAG